LDRQFLPIWLRQGLYPSGRVVFLGVGGVFEVTEAHLDGIAQTVVVGMKPA
jgi:hypothetical protein